MLLPVRRDILSLIAGDSHSSFTSTAHPVLHSLKPASRPSSTPSAAPTTITTTSFPPPSNPTDSAEPTIAVASPSSFLPAFAESRADDDSSKTWEIIGIIIIAVLFIAVSVTFALFFDRLWRFLKDAICCASHPLVAEELVPDSEQQNSPSLLDSKTKTRHDALTRPRQLPWNTQDWNTLCRQPSRPTDHRPPP